MSEIDKHPLRNHELTLLLEPIILRRIVQEQMKPSLTIECAIEIAEVILQLQRKKLAQQQKTAQHPSGLVHPSMRR